MQDLTIRQATLDDCERVRQLAIDTYTVAFGASMSGSQLAAILNASLSAEKIAGYIRDDVVLVAALSQKLIGYVHLSAISLDVTTPTKESKSLRRLYVHPYYQNMGITVAIVGCGVKTPYFARCTLCLSGGLGEEYRRNSFI